MSSVFVIMPFDEEFNVIYENFIKEVFDEAGFTVTRADSIESQQNILKDILQQISHCDLIVADLTGCNANVFYELGLAHALGRQVILITQDLNDLPFDLRSYRTVEYDTHFGKIAEAKSKLKNYAHGFAKNEIMFGNPVSDFLHGEGVTTSVSELTLDSGIEVDDRGFLDHLVGVTEGYGRIAQIAYTIAEAMEQDVNQPTNAATLEMQKLNASGGTSVPRATQKVAQRLARSISTFNCKLNQANIDYAEVIEEIDPSLEYVVSFILSQSDISDPELERAI